MEKIKSRKCIHTGCPKKRSDRFKAHLEAFNDLKSKNRRKQLLGGVFNPVYNLYTPYGS